EKAPMLDVDPRGIRAVHPAQRGHSGGRPELHQASRSNRAPAGPLKLSGPIRVLVVAMLIAAADMIVPRLLGEPLSMLPVRPLWVAGPLALMGAIWLMVK